MKQMSELEKHYNKFNEEKRLNSRHGQVEYNTTMHYINRYLQQLKKERAEPVKILDIGAGTGRYSVPLAQDGYDVTAVELVKYNLGILKSKGSSVKAYQGTALKLSRFSDDSFDLTLLFGPMYHLYTQEDKVKALQEARRVTRPNGIIMVAYLMNEYSIITYAFKERHILECIEKGMITEDFHVKTKPEDLYDYVRLEDINVLNEKTGVTRIQIIAADGAADYMRPYLNALTDEEFDYYKKYQLTICERPELLGSSAHTVDILRNTNKTISLLQ